MNDNINLDGSRFSNVMLNVNTNNRAGNVTLNSTRDQSTPGVENQVNAPRMDWDNAMVNIGGSNTVGDVSMNQTASETRQIPVETIETRSSANPEIQTDSLPSPILKLDRFTELGIYPDFSQQYTGSPSGDVCFSLGGQQFEALKLTLADKSPVFKALFEQKPSSAYVIEKIDPKVFQVMLDYVQHGRIGDSLTEHADGLLEAAHKFGLINLKTICEDYLQGCLSVYNVIDYLLLADTTEAARLKQKAMDYIDEHCPSLVDTDDFQRIVQHKPQLGLELYRSVKQKQNF